MYCKNCGNYNDDNASFCLTCGAALQQPQPQQEEGYQPAEYPQQYEEPKKKLQISKPLLFGIIGGVAAVALAIILLTTLLGDQHTWKGAVVKGFKAVKNMDARSLIEVTYPDKYLDYLLEDEDMTKSEFIKEAVEDAKDAKEDMDSDEKKALKSLDYSITKSKDMDEDDLDDLNERYSDRYDAPDNYFKAGKEVTIKIKYKYDGESYSEKYTLKVVKAGGKWYILNFPFSSIGF